MPSHWRRRLYLQHRQRDQPGVQRQRRDAIAAGDRLFADWLAERSLGTTAFADRPFTWTLTASTGTPLTLPGLGVPALFANTDVLDVSGLGALTPNEPLFAAELASASAAEYVTRASGQGLSFTNDASRPTRWARGSVPYRQLLGIPNRIDTLSGKLTVTNARDLVLSAQLVTVPEPDP